MVLQFALLEAGRQDDWQERDLGAIHLIKYVYLADLAYARRHDGSTFTEAPWRFHHFGPWAVEVFQRVEPAVEAIAANERILSAPQLDETRRWSKTDDERHAELERKLPVEITTGVSRYVREYGHATPELLHFVYSTSPMRTAAPGERLVFVAAPVTKYSVSTPPKLSAKREKQRRKAVAEAKDRLKSRLEAAHAARQARFVPEPRYDEVFLQGLAWLDDAAVAESEGEAIVDDDVWHSETRNDDDD